MTFDKKRFKKDMLWLVLILSMWFAVSTFIYFTTELPKIPTISGSLFEGGIIIAVGVMGLMFVILIGLIMTDMLMRRWFD